MMVARGVTQSHGVRRSQTESVVEAETLNYTADEDCDIEGDIEDGDYELFPSPPLKKKKKKKT